MKRVLEALLAISIATAGITLFKKLNILDKPGNDLKNTRKPVPTLQGIFVYLITICLIAIFHPTMLESSLIRGFLIGGTIIVAFEIIAELEYMGRIKLKVPPISRFFVQMFASVLALRISWISDYELIIFSHVLIIPNRLLYLAFALWSTFVINAINRIDGTNAQGNGILTIGFFTIFALIQRVVFPAYTEYTNFETLLLVRELSLILALISFIYTVIEYKPLALIRDVGTMFLAFGLAYLSVIGGAKIWTIIVALSLVIFDAIRTIRYRLFILKKNPMKGDYTHIHHRLLGLKRTRGEVRFFVWWFSVFMMILMLLQWTNRLNKIIIFVMMALMFFGINTYLFIYKKLPCGLNQKKE